ncbi:MAG TPA: glycosyltransferase family 2 protein [Verrucomicrobiae bacterium]
MNWAQQCIVIIPCFNEEHGLNALLPKLRRFLPNILIVDDGSTDGTALAAGRHGAQVLSSSVNQGKGTAVRQALEHVRRQGYAWTLVMDGDGQHSPEDIPSFFARAESSPVDLVIGNRMDQCENMPFIRRWTNRYLSYCISTLVDQSFPDTQCGFRLIRLDALKGVDLNTTGFEIESEMLAQMALVQRRIDFVPIATIYKDEQSKIHPIRDSLRWYRWLFAMKRATSAPLAADADALKPSQA